MDRYLLKEILEMRRELMISDKLEKYEKNILNVQMDNYYFYYKDIYCIKENLKLSNDYRSFIKYLNDTKSYDMTKINENVKKVNTHIDKYIFDNKLWIKISFDLNKEYKHLFFAFY